MFTPYTRRHVQLSEIIARPPPVGKHFLVFWQNQYPLGHIWYEKDLTQADLRDEIVRAVAPALDHYLQVVGHAGYTWTGDLFRSDFQYCKLRSILGRREKPNAVSGTITVVIRSEEHTSELQSLMRISYAVFCLKNKNI